MSATLVGEPVAETAKLWRYFDLPKLLALLQSGTLYFARIDQLSDPFEGYPTKEESTLAANTLLDPVLGIQSHIIRNCAYASCWSQYDFENAAMWTTYGTTDGGVLIQTTLGTLADSFPPSVYLGQVRYVSDSANELSTPIQQPAERMLRKLSTNEKFARYGLTRKSY